MEPTKPSYHLGNRRIQISLQEARGKAQTRSQLYPELVDPITDRNLARHEESDRDLLFLLHHRL